MNRQSHFIVSLSRADGMTLGSLLLSCLGLLSALHGMLSLAIGFMLLAMYTDMLDGLLARRMQLETEFGRYLDSFCDVFSYLLLPLFILYQFGMRDPLSLTALFAFLVGGVLRLSHFNMTGTVEVGGLEYHLGLQVIWSQLVVVLAFPAWRWVGPVIRYPLSAILLAMSVAMILNLRVRKPTQYVPLTILILSIVVLYFYLHVVGILAP